MARESEKAAQRLGPPPGPGAVLLSNRREGPDLWNVGLAMRPLADLCLSPDAETPFALALVGAPGAGKSFALRRLVEAVEARARSAPALLSKVVVAEVDASLAGSDPAGLVAGSVYAALERDGGAGPYAQLADEAAHGAVDPRQAAAAAAERHDEIIGRLEQERRARDEVEGRRARIAEALLYETPGSRVDSFARASRATIEARLRRFGFAEGDSDRNFRGFVHDLAALRASSRASVFLRALFAYRGQLRLIALGLVAFALAYGLNWLRSPGAADALTSLSAQLAPALGWVNAHDEALQHAGEALVAAGVAALLVNVWRAASFTGLLFRGLRLLDIDMRERRRELDASAARLERRVSSLQVEADAALARAEALAKRVGGGLPAMRPQPPAFLARQDSREAGARAFLAELSRAMAAGGAAPQRLIMAVDRLDALTPAEARRFLEVAVRLAGPGAAVVAAADLARLGEPREIAESLFELVYDVGRLSEGAAVRLISAPVAPPAPTGDPGRSALADPLDEAEIGFLKTASPLIGARPRALKRFYNAYRLARIGEAPRAVVALSLAALMAPDASVAAALRWTLANEAEAPPAGPAELKAAFEALSVQGVGKDAARAAFAQARRFAPYAA
jgi:hypothetical protein